MADYGPAESVGKEGWGVALFVAGLMMWVAGFAYADMVLQVVLGVLGFGLDALALFILWRAKRESAGAAKASGT